MREGACGRLQVFATKHADMLTSPLLCALQVAMNQTVDGTNAVSGLRFLCGDPTCQGTVLASPPPPPPQTATPPAATGDWSPWLGRSTPQSTIGICPCPGYILVRGDNLGALPSAPAGSAAKSGGGCAMLKQLLSVPAIAELLSVVRAGDAGDC